MSVQLWILIKLHTAGPGKNRKDIREGNAEADNMTTEKYEKDLFAYRDNKNARDEAWVRWKSILAKI